MVVVLLLLMVWAGGLVGWGGLWWAGVGACPNTPPDESQFTQRFPKELARILQAIGIIPPRTLPESQGVSQIAQQLSERFASLFRGLPKAFAQECPPGFHQKTTQIL